MTSYHSHVQSYQNHSNRPVSSSYNPVAAMSAPAGTFLPGTKVQVGSHRVVIEKYLSEGGFAHVYVVRLPKPVDGSDVAVLKRVAVPDKAALANMRTEVETMKKLRGHRHIVKYIDSHASQLKGGGFEVFLLMEYCSGGGLIDFMNTRLQNRLTEPEIIKIFSDVAEGVACMHYLKPPLLHRDLKVENVLISRAGKVSDYKLCDFGSSAPPRPAATSAAEGRLIEDDVQRHTTLQYRSPEMIDVYRKQPIDEKSDIWALGVLLYKLCYYTTPFEEVGQMAILNASYKFPSYPQFSDRLKLLISSMLREHPQKRPNIYQVVCQVCHMQGKDIPIRDIYSSRSTSEARRYQQLPPSPTDAPAVGAVFAPPVQQETQVIPEVAPMRRGRPGKPNHSHSSARPSPSPFRGPSTDPFAILDGGSKSRKSADELSNRFPTLDQFDILHEKSGKFDFEPTVAESKPEDEDLAQRLTNALADDAFAKRPSPERAPASDPAVNRRPQPPPLDTKAPRREGSRPAPLHQPVPQKPSMVSTGTMTSPPPPTLPERPIFRFPPSDQDRRPPSQQWAETEGKATYKEQPQPSPINVSKLELRPSASSDRLSNVSVSARPSLDSPRPSNLDADDPVAGRSKSANSKLRPASVHAGSRLEFPRATESARSSLDLSRTTYEDGAPLHQTYTDVDRDYDRANITSDVDYLRAKEVEELSRKKEKRHSGTSKHVKRSSLTTLSRSGTKTIFGSRFGDAFRRFESSHHDHRPRPPSPEPKVKQPTTVTASEVTEPDDNDNDDDDNDDITPEMRRELERRRLSQEEKRVANAAAEYRRRVAEKGEGRRAGGDGPRASSIQNRVQSLFGDANKPALQKTASGYGRFTEESALQETQTELRPEQRPSVRPASQHVYGPYGGQSPVKEKWESPAAGFSHTQRTGPDTRPVAPPKPKNLRVQPEPSRPPTQPSPLVNEMPASPGGDWEANFSRRFPSLSGLEMVETEIEIPRFASLRTKEV